ncbi:MAG: lipoyl synthase [Candidatus Omnitrophota bacterium]|jgi:lipoic acid synthetase
MTEALNAGRREERLPPWLRRSLDHESSSRTRSILGRHGITTVCCEARCPNQSECYARQTATFMILGDVCTRSCGFCAVRKGLPQRVDPGEPERVANAIRELALAYAVVTSVTRDDLPDEGAGHFAQTVRKIREISSCARVEVLTPDFHNRRELIAQVVGSGPVVYNHNLETVESLQAKIRPQADYRTSLGVLETVKALDPGMTVKSGLMLGLGETLDEVRRAAADLRRSGCDLLTLGQYLAPAEGCIRTAEYIPPQVFAQLADEFKALGFREVFAGPYVRSSYHAQSIFSS